MYSPLLFIHSWTRWLLVFATIAMLFVLVKNVCRKEPWGSYETGLLWAYEQILGYQWLFGLTLLMGASPYFKAALQSRGEALSNPTVCFFVLWHPLAMTAAVGVFHGGKKKLTRLDPLKKNTAFALLLVCVALLICAAIPWPFLIEGRPWVRFGI